MRKEQENMSSFVSKVLGATPDKVADLLDLGDESAQVCRPEELAAIYRHQMTAPVAVDLRALEGTLLARLKLLAEANGLLLKSFGDLFHHPAPPLELLRLVKDFAKRNREHPKSPLPREVATVLYYLSIAAASVRCQTQITSLESTRLRQGLAWAANREWSDAPARELLLQAKAALSQDQPGEADAPQRQTTGDKRR